MLKYSEIFSDICRKVAYCLGENVITSYPVPNMENGILTEKIFLYRMSRSVERSRPFAVLTVSAENGEVLSYSNCKYEDFVDTGSHPTSKLISYAMPIKETIEEFESEQAMIRKMYEIIRRFAFSDNVTEQERILLSKYRLIFWGAVPKDLTDYYNAIGKEFFKWVNENV